MAGQGARGHLQVFLRASAVAQQAPRLRQRQPALGVVGGQALAALQRLAGLGNALQHQRCTARTKPGLGLRGLACRHAAEVAESRFGTAQVQQRKAQVEVRHQVARVQLHGAQAQLCGTLGQPGAAHQLAQVGRVGSQAGCRLHRPLQAGGGLQVTPSVGVQDGHQIPGVGAVRHLVKQPSAQVLGHGGSPCSPLRFRQLQHLGEEGGLHGDEARVGDRFLCAARV